MTTAILAILAGLVLLAIGAEGLVRGASRIALQLGVTPLVIGLTIVAAGTGSPEMVVSFQAAFAGSSDLALGNIVGSNIANIALILGLAAVVRPLQVRSALLLREMPIMIGVTLALIAMLADGQLGRIDGALLSIGAVVYTIGAYRASKRDRDAAVAEEFAHELPKTTGSTASNVIFIVGGLGALVFGATLLVDGAVVIAKSIGMSEAVIGLTIVAIGTSLPELATSVLAAWRKDADVSFGNVLGSNILNILLVLGVVAVIQPIGAGGIRSLDLIAMAASAILLYPLMWRGRVLSRWEGALLLVGYGAYIALALTA